MLILTRRSLKNCFFNSDQLHSASFLHSRRHSLALGRTCKLIRPPPLQYPATLQEASWPAILYKIFMKLFHWCHDTQQNDIQHNGTWWRMLLSWLSFTLNGVYAECRMKALFAECGNVECCYAECLGAISVWLGWTGANPSGVPQKL
jgi:hypothetical protein